MQKKEFFGVLLLVSMVSSIMLAGFVSSNVGPQITVYPNSGNGDSEIEWIKGTGWTPNTLVTLFWDQQNLTHAIANVTADKYGKFKVQELEVEGSYIGVHTVIAVQGPTTATALYTMKATTTPDDRILAPIQQLEDKLDNTTSGLSSIQSNFTTVITKIDSVNNTLDEWFDKGGSYNNTAQVQSFGKFVLVTENGTLFDYVYSYYPRRVQITLQISSISPGENVRLYRYIGGELSFIRALNNDIVITNDGLYTYEFETMEWGIEVQSISSFYLAYSVVVIYTPPA